MTSIKKILVLGESGSGKLSLIQALTGSLPDPIPSHHGGLTHELVIKNEYYSATIGIWVDEFQSSSAADAAVNDENGLCDPIKALCDSYASDEAREVRTCLNVIIVTFRMNQKEEKLRAILEQVKRIADECSDDLVLLAVGTPARHDAQHELLPLNQAEESFNKKDGKTFDQVEGSDKDVQTWDDICLDEGYEFINLAATGKNTFGERQGIKRALQVIEACDWSAATSDPSEEELLAEIMAEDAALNEKLLQHQRTDDEDESQATEASIEEMERMMQRVLMAREHLQDLNPEERQKQAIRLVSEIMR